MAASKLPMSKQIMIAVGLGLVAIVAGLMLRKVSEGFQDTTTTTQKPKGPPPNVKMHQILDKEFTASKCSNQSLRGQLHGMINTLPAQKANVKSRLTSMIQMAKIPECKALMEKLVTRPELN